MSPYYEQDGITIYHADCRDVLPSLGANSFSAVVTDPPYGLEFRGESWDAFVPEWIGEARRVASVVAFTTAPTTLWDYPRPDWVCCWYREASNSRSQLGGGFNHWSPVVVYGNPKFPVDSRKFHAIEHAYPHGFPHPSPKPVALMEWLVIHVCDDGGNILDPFMGSGTTLVAGKAQGRKAVGIEIDKSFCDLAIERLAQGVLFGATA